MLCQYCNQEFTPYQYSKTQKYCSRRCKEQCKYQKQKSNKPYNNNCLFCNKPCCIKFCSPKCSAIYHNYGKKYYCKGCNTQISVGWTYLKYCEKCHYSTHNPNYKDWSTITLQNLFDNVKCNLLQYHARLRDLSRQIFKRNNPTIKSCQNCGYDKHIQICHINPVASFTMDTFVSIVNSNDNIIALCPNCHWEFDHNLLTIEEIRSKLLTTNSTSKPQ